MHIISNKMLIKILLLLFASKQVLANSSLSDIQKQASKAIWKLEAYPDISSFHKASKISKSNAISSTGFFISKNKFVTTLHSIRPSLTSKKLNLKITQKNNSRTLILKKIKYLSLTYDIAVLEIEEEVDEYLNLSNQDAKPHDDLFLIGYPDGFFKVVNKISDFLYEDEFSYNFNTDEPFLPGASGSPLLNVNGEVTGVIVKASSNFSFNIKVKYLKKILAQDAVDFKSPFDYLKYATNKLKEDAKQGNPLAQLELNRQYLKETAILSLDREEAFRWLTQSADQGYPLTESYLCSAHRERFMKFYYTQETKDFEQFLDQALYWCDKSAKKGNPGAQMHLAGVLAHLSSNNHDSIHWITQAAEKGYFPAQLKLCTAYAITYRVHAKQSKNATYSADIQSYYNQAIYWCEKSLELTDNLTASVTLQNIKLNNQKNLCFNYGRLSVRSKNTYANIQKYYNKATYWCKKFLKSSDALLTSAEESPTLQANNSVARKILGYIKLKNRNFK